MTTAIAVYNSEGVVGRCDARCHDATSSTCRCICGGRLHGVGGEYAIALNTRDVFGDDFAEAMHAYAELTGQEVGDLRLELPDVQQALL